MLEVLTGMHFLLEISQFKIFYSTLSVQKRIYIHINIYELVIIMSLYVIFQFVNIFREAVVFCYDFEIQKMMVLQSTN